MSWWRVILLGCILVAGGCESPTARMDDIGRASANAMTNSITLEDLE